MVIDVAVLVIGVSVPVVSVSMSAAVGVNFLKLHNFTLHSEAKVTAKSEVHAGHDLALERLVHAALVSEEIKIWATESVHLLLLGLSLVLTITTVCLVGEHVEIEVHSICVATIR